MTRAQPSTEFSRAIIRDPASFVRDALRERLHKGGKDVAFHDPFLLYLTEEQSASYLSAIKERDYRRMIDEPIARAISKNQSLIIDSLRTPVQIYDLGPGLPRKTLPIVRALKRSRMTFRYSAVDISDYFLHQTETYMNKYGYEVNAVRCLFAELPRQQSAIERGHRISSRLVLMGLTFNNFPVNDIVKTLAGLTKPRDAALIAVVLRAKPVQDTFRLPYLTETAKTFNFGSLAVLGLNASEFIYTVSFEENRVEMAFVTARQVLAERLRISKNTRILTAVSYRHSLDELENAIDGSFVITGRFSSGSENVAVIKLQRR